MDNGTIRVLDLLFVMKDEDGVVTTLAIEDLDQEGAAFAEIDITEPGSLNEEDADEVSEDLARQQLGAAGRVRERVGQEGGLGARGRGRRADRLDPNSR